MKIQKATGRFGCCWHLNTWTSELVCGLTHDFTSSLGWNCKPCGLASAHAFFQGRWTICMSEANEWPEDQPRQNPRPGVSSDFPWRQSGTAASVTSVSGIKCFLGRCVLLCWERAAGSCEPEPMYIFLCLFSFKSFAVIIQSWDMITFPILRTLGSQTVSTVKGILNTLLCKNK